MAVLAQRGRDKQLGHQIIKLFLFSSPLLTKKWLKRDFFPLYRVSVGAAAAAVYLCAQGQTPGWVIWPCGRCYRQRRRKMVSVWAVTVCIPRGEPWREGKLHLPQSCALTKFCQSHSQRGGGFTSESTSAPRKKKRKEKEKEKMTPWAHLDRNLLSLARGTPLSPLSQSKSFAYLHISLSGLCSRRMHPPIPPPSTPLSTVTM